MTTWDVPGIRRRENHMEPDRVKHLEFLQNVVTRMNTNSFQIKGWTVTIVSALLALYAATDNTAFVPLGVLPVVIFWLLDAYYLNQERKFRGLYEDAAGLHDNKVPVTLFSMNTAKYRKQTDKKYSYCSALWSQTIATMYVPLILLHAILAAYLQRN